MSVRSSLNQWFLPHPSGMVAVTRRCVVLWGVAVAVSLAALCGYHGYLAQPPTRHLGGGALTQRALQQRRPQELTFEVRLRRVGLGSASYRISRIFRYLKNTDPDSEK